MPFIPHTQADVQSMLATIGAGSMAELFDEIPEDLIIKRHLNIPEGVNEQTLIRDMRERSARDLAKLNFIGAGAYEHHVPAVVMDIASRGEFYTAYTPYQAEASQGTLQVLYEYQTMMANLTGMDVSNASLYDGASALAEAVLMAVRTQRDPKRNRVLIPRSVHPYYRAVVKNIVSAQNIIIEELPFNIQTGQVDIKQLATGQTDLAALVIPQVNFFGVLEDVDVLTDWAHAQGARAIALVNPILLSVLKDPGHWGKEKADIVCGEGQPLGVALSSGGPYFGFICCKQEFVRQMPGRIIGCTVDLEGKRGFALTLQAREQHIRRSKATSNICTNQGLAVTMATVYVSLLGSEGLRRVALTSHENTLSLVEQLSEISGVKPVFTGEFFHEAVLKLPKPAAEILHQLAKRGIEGGFDLSQDYPELGSCILVCATEVKTPADLAFYAQQLKSVQGEALCPN